LCGVITGTGDIRESSAQNALSSVFGHITRNAQRLSGQFVVGARELLSLAQNSITSGFVALGIFGLSP
jgi:hypothetical protein